MLNSYPSHHYQSPSPTHKRVENPQLTPESDLKLERELDALENLVLDGVNLPFSKLTIIDRDRILNQLHLIRNCLPQALNRAIEILHRRQEIIEEAENYSHNLVRSAQEKASKILSESAIIHQAELEASQLKYQVEQECEQLQQQTQATIAHWRELAMAECRDIQNGADDYADGVLDNIEQQLQQMLQIISNGRQQLEENREN
jgi:hypothetical protein